MALQLLHFCMSTQHHTDDPDMFFCLLEIDTHGLSCTPASMASGCFAADPGKTLPQTVVWARNPFSCISIQSLFQCIHFRSWNLYHVGSCSQSPLPVVPGQSEDPLPWYKSPEWLYLLPLQTHPVTHFPHLSVLPLWI